MTSQYLGSSSTSKAFRPVRAGERAALRLFAEDGVRLVIHRDRLISAGVEEKTQLATILRGLLEQLQPVDARGVSADAT